jgi:hypothetical protein
MPQQTPTTHRVDFADPQDTLQYVRQLFLEGFPGRSPEFLTTVFERVCDLFAGRYPGYRACDTEFHDIAHTCQATVAALRILDGQRKSGRRPVITARDFELAHAAILLHDAGYIKKTGDTQGTGAKYTLTHVERSADFAGAFLPPFGVTEDEIRIIRLAIRCTGVQVDTSRLEFHDDRERFLGCALGTGDMLGQMAAGNYPKQLPALYHEFVEAGITAYTSAADLMRRTRGFYAVDVRELLDGEWGQVHRVLSNHFDNGHNLYFEAIERNLDRIDEMLASGYRPS